ncbi:SGNH/GDSL hydrolase family protein [Fulvivirgaceae bacterium BMA10]|uniref:SGNH/GDSL hydrolase family protein n=1 Tax=Splendidivirga corallicola TaxID=3051826 RepID=A0ABT8KT39_9BACT|nr:SGNH/GDSL hydrolase family protein [Fulvivirgaceae bacterium BMA10]
MKKILLISICLFICLFSACSQSKNKEHQMKYLALGDSYTIGESVKQSERWPVVLIDRLRTTGFDIADPKIIATTGWTTGELIEGIRKDGTHEQYDLVSLLIGVNNQYRGYDIEVYKKEFKQLLDQAITFSGNKKNRVFVVSIPDYGKTPFGQEKDPEKIAEELDIYNKINREISEEAGVKYFDITPISRKADLDPELVASDELHPSAKMYEQWVNLIEKEVEYMLK